ncbi:uncharacterized protein L3040_009304 [Drepanopeziza brunnea f. sp. 'multigermtubi']|uniref:uncharacterized protein n=1 Tax=Drepanopeziza brunnea f. sp. 'multigermtubi' TaxID=698441 RepID=UPI002390D6A7|nr:hypothetical protein L3040_009304 [Drepanopeziza brunnea f. sp. 'multigermtubi']
MARLAKDAPFKLQNPYASKRRLAHRHQRRRKTDLPSEMQKEDDIDEMEGEDSPLLEPTINRTLAQASPMQKNLLAHDERIQRTRQHNAASKCPACYQQKSSTSSTDETEPPRTRVYDTKYKFYAHLIFFHPEPWLLELKASCIPFLYPIP